MLGLVIVHSLRLNCFQRSIARSVSSASFSFKILLTVFSFVVAIQLQLVVSLYNTRPWFVVALSPFHDIQLSFSMFILL